MTEIAPVKTREEVLALLRQNRALVEQLGVRRLGLFGSFRRGEPRADSDVDLLIEFAPERKSFRNFMRLAFMLEDLFRRRVELVTPEGLSPHLRETILRDVEYVLA
ncbi:MAG: nucleotidyltransferase [Acidobacteria bacterium]|nr:MAG: nucleotidyltransferase [Acidobacteriota bacterium]